MVAVTIDTTPEPPPLGVVWRSPTLYLTATLGKGLGGHGYTIDSRVKGLETVQLTPN